MPVEAPALLHELSQTWRSFGHEQGSELLRACAMTLIVAAAEGDDPQELGLILSSLMRLHPSRTIVLRACPKRDQIDARTSVQCWMPFGRRQQICGEWIEISAGAGQLAEVVPLLLGLTVPDLPVVLWMRHTALSYLDSLRPVLSLATRVIVDTSEALDAAPALAAVQSLSSGPWRLADLAWGRVTRWRKALAGMLGPLPAPRTGLLQWAGERMSMPACYLAAWLRASFPGLELELSSCDPVLPPARVGRIRVVQLIGSGLDIRLERPAGGSSVAVFSNGLESGLVFPSLDEAALLAEELGIAARDRIFETALARAQAV
ncbi:MAG: glucose-6-phosphate dehydrogenase assembly protein OpcA [Bryobacteraceae bacterium]|jgi:hypothetical protein